MRLGQAISPTPPAHLSQSDVYESLNLREVIALRRPGPYRPHVKCLMTARPPRRVLCFQQAPANRSLTLRVIACSQELRLVEAPPIANHIMVACGAITCFGFVSRLLYMAYTAACERLSCWQHEQFLVRVVAGSWGLGRCHMGEVDHMNEPREPSRRAGPLR